MPTDPWRNRIVGHADVDPKTLVPNERNWRRHPRAQADALDGVLSEVGTVQSVIVNKKTGRLVDGHLRLDLALKSKQATVPVVYVELEPEEEALVLATLDPVAAMAEADGAKLDELLRDVTTGNAAVMEMVAALAKESGLYFGEPESQVVDVEPQIDRAEELNQEWQVKPGDLWLLGDHRLLCGDSTKAEDVERLMGRERADAVLTDPPYGQNQPGVPGDEPETHADLMCNAINLLPISNGVIIAFQSPRTFHAWTDAARKAGFIFERMLWLYKAAQCTFPWRGWILKSESIPVCSIGNPNWQEVNPFSHDCYYLPEVSGELNEGSGWHGAVKPLSVVSDLMSRICASGAVVYEPFSGSGTTIIAAEQLNRKCYAIEIEPKYVAVALQRWADATGRKPERA